MLLRQNASLAAQGSVRVQATVLSCARISRKCLVLHARYLGDTSTMGKATQSYMRGVLYEQGQGQENQR